VHRILKDERDLEISSPPLEATAFQVENLRIAYVFYESGLSINVMYSIDDGRRIVARLRGMLRQRRQPQPGGLASAASGNVRGVRCPHQIRAFGIANVPGGRVTFTELARSAA
jgi:hypothetical protein